MGSFLWMPAPYSPTIQLCNASGFELMPSSKTNGSDCFVLPGPGFDLCGIQESNKETDSLSPLLKKKKYWETVS